MTSLPNRHPVDELGDTREQIKELQKRERELVMIAFPDGAEKINIGHEWSALRYTVMQERINTKALRASLGDKIKPFLVRNEVKMVSVKRLKLDGINNDDEE